MYFGSYALLFLRASRRVVPGWKLDAEKPGASNIIRYFGIPAVSVRP
jgi:hypothetical protein